MAVIFYVSGTGNSLYVAKNIAESLGICRVEGITGYLENPYSLEDEVLGIVCPVHCMGLPNVVREFLEKATMLPRYIFAVATMGAMSGQTLGQIKEILAKRELHLAYGAHIALPDNSIVFPTPQTKRDSMFKSFSSDIGLISRNIKEEYDNSPKLKRNFLWKNGGTAIGWWILKKFKNVDKLHCNIDDCIGCGICVRICPTRNIALNEDKKPTFDKKCISCFGCMHWCPKNAISLGTLKPDSKTKYTNPFVNANELSEQKERLD